MMNLAVPPGLLMYDLLYIRPKGQKGRSLDSATETLVESTRMGAMM